MHSQSESQYKKPNVVQKRSVIYNHKLGDPLASGGHNTYHCLEGLAQALQYRFFWQFNTRTKGSIEVVDIYASQWLVIHRADGY